MLVAPIADDGFRQNEMASPLEMTEPHPSLGQSCVAPGDGGN